MKIDSADVRRKNITFLVELLVGNWSDVQAESGLNRFLFPHIQPSPHTGYWELRTDWEPIINSKLGNHRSKFVYNENKTIWSRNDKGNKNSLHKQVEKVIW